MSRLGIDLQNLKLLGIILGVFFTLVVGTASSLIQIDTARALSSYRVGLYDKPEDAESKSRATMWYATFFVFLSISGTIATLLVIALS